MEYSEVYGLLLNAATRERRKLPHRDVYRYPVYGNTGILGSVLPVSEALRYTGNGIFFVSVYRYTGIFSVLLFFTSLNVPTP